MGWLWNGMLVLGGVVIGAALVLLIIPAIADVFRNTRHAKAWLNAHKHKMPEHLYDDKLLVLEERATPPILDHDGYGSDEHYIFALAAYYNHKRHLGACLVGGFHDQLLLFDASLGPVSDGDIRILKQGMKADGIEDGESLREKVINTREGYIWAQAAQSLHLAGHQKVPVDPEHHDPETAHNRKLIEPHIERLQTEKPGLLDLRTWRLIRAVHWIRSAATLGYIKSPEARSLIADCANELIPRMCRYDDWRVFGRMMAACEKQMRPNDHDKYHVAVSEAVEALLRDKFSPWTLLPIHINDRQVTFAKVVPPLDPVLVTHAPKPYIESFPEVAAGEWLAVADKLMADPTGEVASEFTHEDLTQHLKIDVTKQLLKAHPENPGILLIAAIHYFLLGYEARGHGTASGVSKDQFIALEHCCEIAIGHAMKGHELAPNHAGMIAIMLRALPHTFSPDLDNARQLAHEQADTVFIDAMCCQWPIANHALEKWGGRTYDAFDFARDRMARSTNPWMGLLFLFAACEYIENPIICGGSAAEAKHRRQEDWLQQEMHAAMAALEPLHGPLKTSVQSYCLWWALQQADFDAIYALGNEVDFTQMYRGVWMYRLSLDAHFNLTWLKDTALPGHPGWRELVSPKTPDVVH